MKKFLLLTAILFAFAASGVMAEEMADAMKPAADSSAPADAMMPMMDKMSGMKMCPLDGMEVKDGEGVNFTYEGKEYHFCSQACLEAFKADPAKYIAQMQEMANPETTASEEATVTSEAATEGDSASNMVEPAGN